MNRPHAARTERASRIEPLTRLATGGMADIWLSREVGAAGLERLVVVKRLLPHLAREREIVDMFVSEARFVARLVHPNVVQIHDLGEDEEGYFLVMEYVAGCSVSELLTAAKETGSRIPLEAALCIAEQAAGGAHAAHELCDPTGKPLGLVHRDISPHNLMVGPSGEVKLLDFGIAKATAAAEATRTGSLKGKHGYMSPEQCAGTHLDRRSDVFALGIVCWELLTGVRLFKRETEYASMHAIVSGEFRAPSEVRGDVPRAFDAVLEKALTVSADERWQTADAFRRALLGVAESCGIRPSRDVLVATLHELLGPRLEERERALREAATAGQVPAGLSALRPEGSGRSPAEPTGDGVATVVQGRPLARAEDPSREEATPAPPSPRVDPSAETEEATRVDGRAPPFAPPALVPEDAPRVSAPAEPPPDRATLPRLRIAALLGLTGILVGLLVVAGLARPKASDSATSATSATSGMSATSATSTTSTTSTTSAIPPLPAAPTGPPLRFAVAPTVDPAVLRSEFAPFLRWLGQTLGRPVELTIARSYDDTGDAVATGRADFALLPPLLYVRALAREPRIQPLTVRLFDGSRASDGYLLVREDSALAQPADLRGHTLCYVDRASTTGFLLPRIWMRKAGLVPDKDVTPVMSGDHIAAMRDLIAGKCDAAAVYSGAYLTGRQEGIAVGRLRVLGITGRVPQDIMVATPDMPAPEVKRLHDALLGFDPHRDIDAGRIGEVLGITGFADFQTGELDVIREAAEAEGLIPHGDGGAGE